MAITRGRNSTTESHKQEGQSPTVKSSRAQRAPDGDEHDLPARKAIGFIAELDAGTRQTGLVRSSSVAGSLSLRLPTWDSMSIQ